MTRWQAEQIVRVCVSDREYGIFLILRAVSLAEAGELKPVEPKEEPV